MSGSLGMSLGQLRSSCATSCFLSRPPSRLDRRRHCRRGLASASGSASTAGAAQVGAEPGRQPLGSELVQPSGIDDRGRLRPEPERPARRRSPGPASHRLAGAASRGSLGDRVASAPGLRSAAVGGRHRRPEPHRQPARPRRRPTRSTSADSASAWRLEAAPGRSRTAAVVRIEEAGVHVHFVFLDAFRQRDVHPDNGCRPPSW